MTQENMYEKLRKECWDKAIDAFGYSYIFGKRIIKYRNRIRLLTAFGILVPVAAGGIAFAYYKENQFYVDLATYIAAPLTIIQLLLSISSLIYRWDDSLSYSLEASTRHTDLSSKFKKLANTPPPTEDELGKQYDLLELEYTERAKQDAKEGIKEWENRVGMRAALRNFQRKCIGCNTVPLDLNNSDCSVCGNYPFYIRNK